MCEPPLVKGILKFSVNLIEQPVIPNPKSYELNQFTLVSHQ